MYRIGCILYFSIYCKVSKLFSRFYDFFSTLFIDVVKFRLEYISIHSSVFSCVHKVHTFFSWLGVLERFTTSKLSLFRFFRKIRTFLWKIFNNFFFCFVLSELVSLKSHLLRWKQHWWGKAVETFLHKASEIDAGCFATTRLTSPSCCPISFINLATFVTYEWQSTAGLN